MNQFGRALKLSLNHRFNVAACIFSSLVVAVLWGGNLTAVYPLVNVIMNDHSLPEWIDEKIAESDQEVSGNTRWLDVLKNLPATKTDELRDAIQTEIADRQAELADHFASSGRKLDHIEIAEKTRLTNVIADLESIRQAPADKITVKLANEKSEAERQIKAYHSLAERYRWISPTAHRWLPATPLATLVLICFLVLVGTLLKSLARIWNTYLVARLSNMVGYDLRMDFYRQMLRLDMSNFTESGRGDLMNRCTSDLNSVSQGVQRIFGQALLEPLQMLVCLGFAAYVSWQLLLLTMVVAPPAGYAIFWLGKSLKRTHRRAMQEFSFIYETLTETLSGIKLIQAFTMEPAERNKFNHSSKEYYRRQMKIATYNSLVNPVTEVLGIIMVLIAALMGGYLVLGQHTHIFGIKISELALDHGQMSMFFAMLAGLADPARRLSQEFNQLQQGVAAADRVYEIIDREPKIVDPIHPLPLPALSQSLVFENIDFSYQPEKQVLDGVSLAIKAGETIAIVGPNGCGKSTLLQLLLRFYDPQHGRITLDGTDIRDVRLRDLRMRFGVVTQETLLFNDTVANNIAYGAPEATRADVEAAARKAYAHTFVMEKLPEGYDSLVGPGGSRLSGGQRQRIALARAILRNPEVLILDEATSQIDVESEQLIHAVLRDFSRDRTTLLVTHRTSTISLADRVVVMDQGRILDVGTDAELSSRCELYRRLCHNGYRETAA
jgi:ATP-binding cassette subfamily B protein/subfamily B ATP-binding cassette protein MsbA